MLERLQSIHPRLQELARLDPQFRLFGAGTHRYQLAPPLAPDKVATFELLHGVRLPEDYRAFLLQLGSEGVGPYYGLKALGDFEHAIGHLAGLEDEPENWRLGEGLDSDFLSSPFPHLVAFQPMDDSAFEGLSEEEEQSRIEATESEIWQDKWVLGTLCVSEYGCNIRDLLVVSGEERGHIWRDDRCDLGGLHPLELNRTRLPAPKSNHRPMFVSAESARTSFLDWYEWWLDWSLAEVKEL